MGLILKRIAFITLQSFYSLIIDLLEVLIVDFTLHPHLIGTTSSPTTARPGHHGLTIGIIVAIVVSAVVVVIALAVGSFFLYKYCKNRRGRYEPLP